MRTLNKFNILALAIFFVGIGLGTYLDNGALMLLGLCLPFVYLIIGLPIIHHYLKGKDTIPFKEPWLLAYLAERINVVMSILAAFTLIGVIASVFDWVLPGSYPDALVVALYVSAWISAIFVLLLFLVSTEKRFKKYRQWFAAAYTMLVIGLWASHFVSPDPEIDRIELLQVTAFWVLAMSFLTSEKYNPRFKHIFILLAIIFVLLTLVAVIGIALFG